MEAFIGTILPVAFNYPPRGWVFCNGQLMNVSNNSALFALLGTMYGGDGRTTFGIPDLRGRVMVGSQAQGPGLQNVSQGEKGGTNAATVVSSGSVSFSLSQANLPPHAHGVVVQGNSFTATSTLKASPDAAGGQTAVTGSTLCSTQGVAAAPQAAIYQTTTPSTLNALNPDSVTTVLSGTVNLTTAATGNGTAVSAPVTVVSAAFNNMQPYIGMNFILCVDGIFPSRN